VDLGEQASDAVGDAGDLAGEVVVVADQDFQFGQRLVAGVDPPQRVRQGASSIGDHVRVSGVGLRRTWMQVGQPAHDQARQVGHLMPARASDRHGQRTDRGGLVDHDQDPAVSGEFVEQLAQPGLRVRQRGVVQPLPVAVQRDRVVSFLADVESYKDAELVMHARPPHRHHRGSAAGTAPDCRQPRYEETYPEQGWPGPYQRSADATRPGDNTPRIMPKTGAVSHTEPGDRAVPGWGRSKR